MSQAKDNLEVSGSFNALIKWNKYSSSRISCSLSGHAYTDYTDQSTDISDTSDVALTVDLNDG